MRTRVRLLLLLTAALAPLFVARESARSETAANAEATHYVTNIAQFRSLSGTDFLAECDFHLAGVVTLVDMNRNLLALQDASGAVALNFPLEGRNLRVGQRVALDGTNCSPYFSTFPDFPYRPSGRNISSSFEAPRNWGEYNLTRMRGYLHPPVTGEYSFWIASDNSSQLWLSENADPSKARKIASIARFEWVAPREWSRFPSQHSEQIHLQAGESYYIEALGEQTTVGEHLAVAWQGPGLEQSVIPPSYLTPWESPAKGTHGILREYWTNFSAGDLEGLAGPRAFESALTVEKVHVSVIGRGELPKPEWISLNEPLPPKDNYRWVQVQGLVKFAGMDGDQTTLELSNAQAAVQVRAPEWSPEMSRRARDTPIRVEGVCEGVFNQNGTLSPGVIWPASKACFSFVEATTNADASTQEQPPQSATAPPPPVRGFYSTRGVVTFDDRVFGNRYIFVQEDSAAVMVSLEDTNLVNHLKVGDWVDLGGALERGKYGNPVLTPLVVKNLGWHVMPSPLMQPLDSHASASREGRWSEVEGVVHSLNTNGTVSLVGNEGSLCLWIGQTSSNCLDSFVDARLRVRGVLTLSLLGPRTLLVPSLKFVDVEEPAPKEPFDTPRRAIADIVPEKMESSWFRRVRVVGQVTYRGAHSFFVQDSSGGIRVRTVGEPAVEEGQTVEVVAFPASSGVARTLTDALVRPAGTVEHLKARNLDLNEAFSPEQSGTLVQVSATLLACKTNGTSQVLELQEQQRVFLAALAGARGELPALAPGSRVRVTGVCDDQTTDTSLTKEMVPEKQFLPSLEILLRSPEDIAVISGPPWWSLQRIMILVGTLFAATCVTLLWVHLLRRRLERQQAARLAFSRQVLERLEDERRRIAVNLHDSLGQILLAIKNHALLAIQHPPDEAGMRQRFDEISGITSQAIEEVRQITHGLRPYQLDRLGLTQAIRASINQTTRDSAISFATRVEDIDGLFDKDAEIHLYRIVQEAVTNIVKHSAATEAAVVIKKRPATVSLSIRDNGRGFDPARQPLPPHDLGYGLNGIAERVRILGGTLAIDSQLGEGTSLTVEVPLRA